VTSLLTLRTPAPGTAPGWALDAVPHAYEEAGRQQFLAMPGVKWVRDRTSPTGRGFYRGPFDAIEIVAATLEAARVCIVRREAPHAPWPVSAAATAIEGLASERVLRDLRSYQREGSAWLAWMGRYEGGGLLADDMGIGKSIQAIAAAAPFDSPIQVVCPAIVRGHWRRQIALWARNGQEWLEPLSYQGFLNRWKADEKARADYTAGIFSGPARQTLPSVGLVVADEMHYLANPKSQTSKGFAGWLARHETRPVVFGLTGTPLATGPADLWHQLELIWPGRFGTYFAFTKRYAGGHFAEIEHIGKSVWTLGAPTNVEELAARLARCVLRRTKAQVASELPKRTRVVVEVELPAAARRASQKAAAALDWKGGAFKANATAGLSVVEEHKISAAVELARDAMKSGSRPLVLTTRKDTARQIATALGAALADGDTDNTKREAILRDAPAGVSTIFAVTTGIDLVGYDVVIFVGLSWVPWHLSQAESRLHRIGQEREVTAYYLVGVGTLDEIVRERVIERLEMAGELLGSPTETEFAEALGGSEEDLLAAIVAAVKSKAA
jgi:SNF2 family DNA or RNA helicase